MTEELALRLVDAVVGIRAALLMITGALFAMAILSGWSK